MGQPRWLLVALEGAYAGRQFPVVPRGLTFGREAENDLVLDDEKVSRRHAIVRAEREGLTLEDLRSRNGTFVNNQRVERSALKVGDRIALGSHLFKVALAEADVPAARPPEGDPEKTIVRPQTSLPLRSTVAIQVGGDAGPARPNLAAPPAPVQRPPDPAVVLGGAASAALEMPAVSAYVPAPPAAVAMQELPSMAGAAAPELAATPYLEPIVPVRSLERQKKQKLMVGVAAGLVLMVGAGLALLSGRSTPASAPDAKPSSVASSAGTEAPSALGPLSSNAEVVCNPEGLSAEEKKLSSSDQIVRANEHFDEGERFMESDKLKEACTEFEKALALNADCKVCLIRLSKVKSEIKKRLEKYESEALRSYQAMEYDKAVRYWQMVLELESNPAGRRRANDELQKTRSQLHQQSYR